MFNLSLSLLRQKRREDALDAIDRELEKEPGAGPYLTQRALCLRELGRGDEAEEDLEGGRTAFGDIEFLSDWELGWLLTCAEALGDRAKAQEARKERERRKKTGTPGDWLDVPRPITKD